jgi:hypothetical protein
MPELTAGAVGDLARERCGDRIHSPPQLGDRTLPLEQFRIREPRHLGHRERRRGIAEGGEIGEE